MTGPIPIRLPDGDRAIATRGIAKRFGRQVALRDLTLDVPLGAIYLLVGPNGAGKSTSLKVLLDLVRADDGTAEVFGLDVRTDAPAVRANIGYVPERHDWGYGWMRVGRLLEYHAAYYPTWDRAYAARLTELFELSLDRRLRKLSKGQARRVHLVMALAHRPALLLLDEPTDGLDPVMRDEVLGVLAQHLTESPTTVLLSTHHPTEVETIADHIGVLRDGELRAQVPLATLGRHLRRYRTEVPEGWSSPATLDGAVLRRVVTQREIQWTVWGEEPEITRQLTSSGVVVRESAPLSLHEATLALLDPRG